MALHNELNGPDLTSVKELFQAMEKVKWQEWSNVPEADKQRVINAIIAIDTQMAKQEGRTKIKEVIIEKSPRIAGFYESEKNAIHLNVVHMTQSVGDNRIKMMPAQVLETIIHEGIHAQQQYKIDHTQPGKDAEIDKLRNNGDFYSPPSDPRAYRFEKVEREAFDGAAQVVEKVFNKLKDDPMYKDSYEGYADNVKKNAGEKNEYRETTPEEECIALSDKNIAHLALERDKRLDVINNVDPNKPPINAQEAYLEAGKKIIATKEWRGHTTELDETLVTEMLKDGKYKKEEIIKALDESSPKFVPGHPGDSSQEFVNKQEIKLIQNKNNTVNKSTSLAMSGVAACADGPMNGKNGSVYSNDPSQSKEKVLTQQIRVADARNAIAGFKKEIDDGQRSARAALSHIAGRPLTVKEAKEQAIDIVKGGGFAAERKTFSAEMDRYTAEHTSIKEEGQCLGIYRYLPKFLIKEPLTKENREAFDKGEEKLQTWYADLNRHTNEFNEKDQRAFEGVNTPEGRRAVSEKTKELLELDKQQLAKREELKASLEKFAQQQQGIAKYEKALPRSIDVQKIYITGDSREPQNLLAQTDKLAEQTATHIQNNYQQKLEQRQQCMPAIGRGVGR